MTIPYSLVDDFQDATFSTSTQRRVRALTRITDLFLAGSTGYSKQQIELFDEVFKMLVAAIELKARARLAVYLAKDPAAPSALVRVFAFDEEISVAGPILSQSTAIAGSDLATVARSRGPDHLCAIARRRTIDEAITDILVQRGDLRVVRALVRNAGARFSPSGFRELVEWSKTDAELAADLGRRGDIPRVFFLKLLEFASASVCRKIVAAHPEYLNAVPVAVTDVIDELNEHIRESSAQHRKARKKVNRRKYWNELGEQDVQAAARAQDFERVASALSVLARCPIELVERAVLGENPGAVQVVAKAAECSWATVKALLLMRAAGRKLSTMDLDRAREHFERLETATAKRVLAFHAARRTSGAAAVEGTPPPANPA